MTKKPCPHCLKPYVTFLENAYTVADPQNAEPGSVKQFYAARSKWRCMSCGRTFFTERES